MEAGRTKTVLVTIAMFVGCGVAFAQTDSGAALANRIHALEPAIGAAPADGPAWLRLAILYEDEARFADAERAFRRAKGLLKRANRVQYADALDQMGVMYVERGKFAKAEALERKSLAIRQERNDAAEIGRSYMHLALVAYGKHDMRGAETNAELAVSLLVPEHAVGAGADAATSQEKMSALIDLALIRCAEAQCDVAKHHLARALELATANYQPNSVPVGFLQFLLGYTQTRSGDLEGGMRLMKIGIDEMKTQMGWGHPTYVAALKEYRVVLVRTGNGEEATRVEESIAKLERSSGSVGNSKTKVFSGINALR